MSLLNDILNWGPLSRVRRNHALEHATLQVLGEKHPSLRAAGYSDPAGFWLMGDVPTEQVRAAVNEALARLRAGEHKLAIHPHCGTNLVASGMMAGTAGWLGMLGTGNSWRARIERWPVVVTLVTVAILLSQPLGPYLQARVTTLATTQELEVVSIQRSQRGDAPIHRVLTRG